MINGWGSVTAWDQDDDSCNQMSYLILVLYGSRPNCSLKSHSCFAGRVVEDRLKGFVICDDLE